MPFNYAWNLNCKQWRLKTLIDLGIILFCLSRYAFINFIHILIKVNWSGIILMILIRFKVRTVWSSWSWFAFKRNCLFSAGCRTKRGNFSPCCKAYRWFLSIPPKFSLQNCRNRAFASCSSRKILWDTTGECWISSRTRVSYRSSCKIRLKWSHIVLEPLFAT